MSRAASSVTITEPESWLTQSGRFSDEWQGAASGAGICVIANLIEEVGGGVSLHKHPYAETFVVRKGKVSFSLAPGRSKAAKARSSSCRLACRIGSRIRGRDPWK